MIWRRLLALATVVVAVGLAGCAGTKVPGTGDGAGGGWPGRDGPGENPPADLASVPDAVPQVESIRSGGPNKPYEVLGQSYTPFTADRPFTEKGLASWYGRKFHGRRTASGEVYNMYAMTAAHPTLPIPSYARIRNPANGREVVVRVNDRGPFHPGRIVDLSYTAALKLDLLRGIGAVELQRLTFEEIRAGTWRRDTQLAIARDTPVPVPATAVAPVAAQADDTAPEVTPAPTTDAVPAAAPVAEVAAVVAEAVPDAPAARAFTSPARGFWVQLGAFRAHDGAETFQRKVSSELDWLSPMLTVFGDATLYKLQAGPFPSRDEARRVAERVRGALALTPVIVERR